MVKIGRVIADRCGIGILGTGFEVGSAKITNTEFPLITALRPRAHPNEQEPSGPLPGEVPIPTQYFLQEEAEIERLASVLRRVSARASHPLIAVQFLGY